MVPSSGPTGGVVQYPIILEVPLKDQYISFQSETLIAIGEANIHQSHEAPLWGARDCAVMTGECETNAYHYMAQWY
jgi:hypothetical protein